jgi:hypothetical protein
MNDENEVIREVVVRPVEKESLRDSDVDSDKEFFDYLKHQVNTMESYLTIGAGKEINFYELEEALKGYTHIQLTLVSMHNIARIEYQKEEEEFNQWYAEKFVFIRAKHNLPEKTAQKWASQKELDSLLRVEFRDEFIERKKRLLGVEQKVSFLHSLLKLWEGYSYTLNTLSTNVRAEIGTANFSKGVPY